MGLNPADGLVALVSLVASTVGAVCGVGGGILIKPVLDAVSSIDVATVNFLSGATVLSMTAYSVARSIHAGSGSMDLSRDTPLAVGAAFGGLAGKQLFSALSAAFPYPRIVGCSQAAALFAVCLFTIAYTVVKDRREIHGRRLSGWLPGCAVGVGLGAVSAFLGIGGGPLNIVAMTFFFAMASKDAVQASLYIILYSQTAATVMALATQDLSGIDPVLLVGMVAFGIAGAAGGRTINRRLSNATVDRLFIGLLVAIMAITVANFLGFAAM